MLYTSEVTGKSYKTVKELEADEKLAKEEEEKKSKALGVKKTRAKEGKVMTTYPTYRLQKRPTRP